MKKGKEILSIVDNIDIAEKEYTSIKVDFTEIDKERLKRNLTSKILSRKKKVKKYIMAASLSAIFILSGTFLYKPAFANDIKFIQPIYERLGYYKEYQDYTNYIGKSVEDKGYKFTVDNMVGTKDRLVIGIKIESNNPLPKNCKNDFMCLATPNGTRGGGASSYKSYFLNDKTLILLLETKSEVEYSKFGDININIHNIKIGEADYNVNKDHIAEELNVNFNFKVDFSRAFANSSEIKVDKSFDINGSKKRINSIESNILGTILKGKVDNYNKAYDYSKDNIFIYMLKVDDKIYTESSSSTYNDKMSIIFNGATYDKLKNSKEISLIPIRSLYNNNERNNKVDNALKNLKLGDMITTNGIEYPDKIYFSDNRVGEFYKVEREKNIIRIYFKGEGEILPLVARTYLDGYYNEEKTDENINLEYYDGTIYKDKNVINGYIKEFKVNDETSFKLGYFNEPLVDGLLKVDSEIKLK